MIILPKGANPSNRELQRMRGLLERRWNPYIRKFQSRFRKAIVEQSEQAIKEVEKEMSADVESRVLLAITPDPIQEVIDETYSEVSKRFFDLTRNLKVGKKDMAETTFLQELARFVLLTRAKKVKNITETTRDNIKKVVVNAVTKGWGSEKTAKEINKATRISSRVRARTIARTEVIGASNYGQQKGAESTGLGLKKIWVTTLDGRERQSHREANRDEVALSESFVVGGEEMLYPHAEGASAKNVINCRCTVVYQEQ